MNSRLTVQKEIGHRQQTQALALGTKIRRRRQKSKKDGKEGNEGKLKRENEKGEERRKRINKTK